MKFNPHHKRIAWEKDEEDLILLPFFLQSILLSPFPPSVPHPSYPVSIPTTLQSYSLFPISINLKILIFVIHIHENLNGKTNLSASSLFLSPFLRIFLSLPLWFYYYDSPMSIMSQSNEHYFIMCIDTRN